MMFEVLIDIIESAIVVFFLRSAVRHKETSRAKAVLIIILSVLAKTICTIAVGNVSFLSSFEFLIIILSVYCLAEINCDGFHFEKLSVSIIYAGISTVSSLLTSVFVPIILNKDIEHILAQNNSKERVFAVLFAKTIQLLLCVLVIFVLKRINAETNERIWFIYSLLLLCSFVCSDIATSMMLTDDKRKQDVFLILLTISLFAVDLFVFSLFIRMLRDRDTEYQFREIIEKGYSEVENIKNKELMLENFREMVHEIRNEYIPVREMLVQGKKDEAVKKLDEIIGESETFISDEYYSGTEMSSVDAVIGYYKRRAVEIGTKVNVRVTKFTVDKSREKIICSILLNQLKNAYEAAQREHCSLISVEISVKKEYIKLTVKNAIEKSILENNNELKTTKKDSKNHGYGLRTIERMAEKNDGKMLCYEEEGFFVNEVWIRDYEKG